MKIIAMATVAAIVLAAPLAVSAQTASDRAVRDENTNAVRVVTSDLDLSRADHARIMLDRIDRAALEACGASTFSAPEYQAATRDSACYQDGVQQGVAQANAPEVTKLYKRRSVEVGA